MKMTNVIPALPVIHIDKAVTFYTDRLGFMPRHVESGFAICCRDDIELHLWAASDKKWKRRWLWLRKCPVVSGAESFLAGTASCRIGVLEIDRLFEEYRQQDVLYASDTVVTSQHWGVRDFPARDLYGNLLTFYEECK